MSQEVVEFCQELGPNEESGLIQNFGSIPSLVLSMLIRSPITYKNLEDIFGIIKDVHIKGKDKGAYVIGKEISRIIRNKPKTFSQLSVVLGQKERIAKIMFERKGKEDEISEKEIVEWLKLMHAGLLKAKYINVRRL